MNHIALRQAHGAVQDVLGGENLKFLFAFAHFKLLSSRKNKECLAHEQKQLIKNTKKSKNFWIEKFDSKLRIARDTISFESPKPRFVRHNSLWKTKWRSPQPSFY